MPYKEVRLTQCWFSKTVVNAPKILSSKSDQLCWVSLLLLTRPGRPKICTIVTWMFSVHCAAQSWAHSTIVSTIWQGFKANNNVVCHISAKYTVVSKLHVEQEKTGKMKKEKNLKTLTCNRCRKGYKLVAHPVIVLRMFWTNGHPADGIFTEAP